MWHKKYYEESDNRKRNVMCRQGKTIQGLTQIYVSHRYKFSFASLRKLFMYLLFCVEYSIKIINILYIMYENFNYSFKNYQFKILLRIKKCKNTYNINLQFPYLLIFISHRKRQQESCISFVRDGLHSSAIFHAGDGMVMRIINFAYLLRIRSTAA